MKAVLFSGLFSAALVASAFSATAHADQAADLAAQAKASFEKRDYSNPGIASAQAAADLYAQAAVAAADNVAKAKYLTLQAASLYFVGDANADSKTKIEVHLRGMTVADQAVKLLGIADVASVTDQQIAQLKAAGQNLEALADALYERGINLGEWGQANGVVQSLSKWPELRHNMEIMEGLGQVANHEYGSYRVLGRGFFKIPGLLGGSMDKATKYLSTAFKATKKNPAFKDLSTNANNNVYYAEVLHENGDDDKAKALLQAFIAADAAALSPESAVETKHMQDAAKELLKGW